MSCGCNKRRLIKLCKLTFMFSGKLADEAPHLVLSDFGSALAAPLTMRYVDEFTDLGGNLLLRAPEISRATLTRGARLDFRAADLWAAGTLGVEILTGYVTRVCACTLSVTDECLLRLQAQSLLRAAAHAHVRRRRRRCARARARRAAVDMRARPPPLAHRAAATTVAARGRQRRLHRALRLAAARRARGARCARGDSVVRATRTCSRLRRHAVPRRERGMSR